MSFAFILAIFPNGSRNVSNERPFLGLGEFTDDDDDMYSNGGKDGLHLVFPDCDRISIDVK